MKQISGERLQDHWSSGLIKIRLLALEIQMSIYMFSYSKSMETADPLEWPNLASGT